MDHLIVEVQKRDTRGKNTNRRLRADGQVPAVVYGGGKESVAIQIRRRSFEELMKTAGSENAVFLLKLAGTDQSRHTMIKELQQDPVTGQLIHIDFLRVLLDQKIRAHVQIEVHGEPLGVKNEGGMLDFVTREVEVECLPDKIPSQLVVDVSQLHVGQHVEAGQLELPEGVELHGGKDRVIVAVSSPKGAAVDEEADEDELLERVAAEPEVIGRSKDE